MKYITVLFFLACIYTLQANDFSDLTPKKNTLEKKYALRIETDIKTHPIYGKYIPYAAAGIACGWLLKYKGLSLAAPTFKYLKQTLKNTKPTAHKYIQQVKEFSCFTYKTLKTSPTFPYSAACLTTAALINGISYGTIYRGLSETSLPKITIEKKKKVFSI